MFKRLYHVSRRAKIDAALASLGITALCLIVVYALALLFAAAPS